MGFGEKKKKKDKAKQKPGPTVCEVLEVLPIPKKNNLRLCKVRAAVESEPIDIVTNAPNVVEAKKFIVALPGVTTATNIEVKPAKIGGVESAGMFCSPLEMGWATDLLDEKLAVMLSDSAEVGAPAPNYEEAVQALKDREAAISAQKAKEEEAKTKKGKKKGGKAKQEDDDDLDALLNEFKVEEGNKEEPTPAAGKGKKAKKGGKQANQDEDDAVLDQVKGNEEEVMPTGTAAKSGDVAK